MIFVIVGSQKFPFDRLIREVDRLKETGVIADEVVAQIGVSTYEPKYLALEKQRCIVNVENIDQLESAVRNIGQMALKPYQSGNDSIIRLLRDFIGD